jgi:phage tail tape-measure protein
VLELREVLRAEYRNRPPEQIEQIFESTLGVSQEDLEDLEDFWKTLQGVGGAVSKALPGIASGALTGAGTGAALGPWGALGGALIGGTVGGQCQVALRLQLNCCKLYSGPRRCKP